MLHIRAERQRVAVAHQIAVKTAEARVVSFSYDAVKLMLFRVRLLVRKLHCKAVESVEMVAGKYRSSLHLAQIFRAFDFADFELIVFDHSVQEFTGYVEGVARFYLCENVFSEVVHFVGKRLGGRILLHVHVEYAALLQRLYFIEHRHPLSVLAFSNAFQIIIVARDFLLGKAHEIFARNSVALALGVGVLLLFF